MNIKNQRHHYWRIALIAYVCLIYINSLTPASVSSRESGFVLRHIQQFLTGSGFDALWLTEHIIRKSAHFMEYTGLGVLLFMSVPAHGFSGFRTAFELAAAIPLADETIQLFTAGRSGQISDVWLDICGAVFGMAVTFGLWKFYERKYK